MMNVALFSHWESETSDEDYEKTGLSRACVSYPAVITDESSASSYGQPVVILPANGRHMDIDAPDGWIAGEPLGPADMPDGELQIADADLAGRLRALGYQVAEDDGAALELWTHAPGTRWPNEDARLVQY